MVLAKMSQFAVECTAIKQTGQAHQCAQNV